MAPARPLPGASVRQRRRQHRPRSPGRAGNGSAWPAQAPTGPAGPGICAICRRERPHPGAAHKLAFTDQAGTASRCSSPTRPTPTPPCWRLATGPTPMWKTASAAPRPRGCATCCFQLRRQRRLAHPGHGGPDPGLLGAGAAAGRRLEARRAQDAALPAVARSRPDRPSRPPSNRAAGPRLALGRRPGRRVRQAAGLACPAARRAARVVGRSGREGGLRCASPCRDRPVRWESPTR
jgi:hypothetical protein